MKPISENLLDELDENHLQGSLFNKINFHTKESGIPDLNSSNLCLIGISETRNSYFQSDLQDLNLLRKELYNLKQGKWKITISDLGDLPNGSNVEDTYHALYDICKELYSKKITLVIIGGSNDIIYPIFKSFDSHSKKVNIVSIDNQFDLYQDSDIISGRTYMNKIILDDSNKLNDFTNIGYQRHLCSYEEIELMEKLFFEKISLGEILENNMKAEPIIRDADIVGFDMKSLSFSANSNPSGIDSRLACILSKYVGQSNKISFFGLFDLNKNEVSNKLYSEIIWYFIDSFNNRTIESNFDDSQLFFKYIVQTSGRDIIFYKSKISERWWMTINLSSNEKIKFLPCLESDYQDALNDNIPIRWLKASKRI
ncbi:MAG: formimidoylglutamase [Bacteroidetes bacterium]|nr:formimidoylglutamase [Bacteroidota bacterium]MDA1225255.1 formimidoylglutamase [Bacteroidota bacterium]